MVTDATTDCAAVAAGRADPALLRRQAAARDLCNTPAPLPQVVVQRGGVVSRPGAQPQHRRQRPVQPARFMEGEDGAGAAEPTENRVIVVTSGKGGVGKTTASANLGMSIARCA